MTSIASEEQVKAESQSKTAPASARAEANGAGGIAEQLKKQAHMKQAMQSKMLSSDFGNIITILMQSPGHQDLSLADLPARIIPPLVKHQFLLAEATKQGTGFSFPVGLVFWARVSDEVDQRLSEELDKPIQLSEEEWTSGDHFWLVETVGEKRFVQQLLGKLCQGVLKDKAIKTRVVDEDGKPSVEIFNTSDK